MIGAIKGILGVQTIAHMASDHLGSSDWAAAPLHVKSNVVFLYRAA